RPRALSLSRTAVVVALARRDNPRPSAARNRRPILEVLTRVLPNKGIVLEIGSGTGEHATCFAKALTGLIWMPSDPDEDSRASIHAWIATEDLANVRAPIAIDVREGVWGV